MRIQVRVRIEGSDVSVCSGKDCMSVCATHLSRSVRVFCQSSTRSRLIPGTSSGLRHSWSVLQSSPCTNRTRESREKIQSSPMHRTAAEIASHKYTCVTFAACRRHQRKLVTRNTHRRRERSSCVFIQNDFRCESRSIRVRLKQSVAFRGRCCEALISCRRELGSTRSFDGSQESKQIIDHA